MSRVNEQVRRGGVASMDIRLAQLKLKYDIGNYFQLIVFLWLTLKKKETIWVSFVILHLGKFCGKMTYLSTLWLILNHF